MKNLAAPLALALLAGAAAASDLTLRTIVLTGTPAPGMPTLAFDFVSDPRLAAGGQVAFFADVAGPGVTDANNGTLWSDRTGPLALVLREGDATLISPTTYYYAIPYPNFTDTLRFGVTASTEDSDLPPIPHQPIRLGIFSEFAAPPGFAPIARDGDTLPNFPPPGTGFSGIVPAPMTDTGLRAFTSNAGGVLWSGDDSGVAPVAVSGDPAPGTPGQRYGALFEPALAPSGTLVYAGTLLDPLPATTPVGTAIWQRTMPGPLTLVVRTGGNASGVAGLYKELGAHPAVVSHPPAASVVAFWGRMESGKVTEADDTAIWIGTQFTTTPPRIREGSAAPGAGPGVFFDELSGTFSVAYETSGLGTSIAFRGSLRGSGVSDLNNSGIWLSRQGSFTMIAREGDQAPRLPAGTVFASFSDPVLTERGQVVFLARLRGGGTTDQTGDVLFATELARPAINAPAGRAVPVVRTGDAFPVSGMETRIVHHLSFDSQPKGTGYSATDTSGSFLFKLVFKDPIVPPPPPPTYPFRFTEGLFQATVRCLADLNADGVLNLADFGAFQTAYALGDLREADSNGDGALTLSDFGSFQSSFALGCP
ncbi:MAG: hypothetical protein IT437_06500 [Phycisphaerales bacterium]|nr:hypothetical protein [Phycisphaerales bacterium]